MGRNEDSLDAFYGWLTGLMQKAHQSPEPIVTWTRAITATVPAQQQASSRTVIPDSFILAPHCA